MSVRSWVAVAAPRLPRRRLSFLAKRVLAGEGRRLEVCIVYTGDAQVRDLNARYRRLDRTTDVLSFNVPGVRGLVPDAGEIYLSLPQARRQARRYRHSLTAELERLVVHGVLHLLGYDHKQAHDARRMKLRERHYLGDPA
jgi:probable rRNA maturation factor